MKYKATKKEIRENYANIICVPYCGLQALLRLENPHYYNSGTYGWNFDVYTIDPETVIVTGYRPFGNFRPEYEMTKEYERKAEAIWEQYRWLTDYDFVHDELRKLIAEFVKEVCGE